MKSARERMDVISAYREIGTYRGAAAICGTTHKTVKRIIEAHESAGAPAAPKAPRARNYDAVTDVVTKRVADTAGRITAKRLLPEATAAGYDGSARTSVVWSRMPSRHGETSTPGTVDAGPRCGPRVRR